MRSLIISLFLIISHSYNAQLFSKYLRKNSDPKIVQYATDHSYARSVLVIDSTIYLGSSNGKLYAYNLSNDSTINLMRGRMFTEMRDLELVNNQLIGMQSGEYGILAKLNQNHFVDYIIPESNMWHDIFLDGMGFKDSIGFIMGDPVNGFFSLYYSVDFGETWEPCEGKLEAGEKEAGFAASGTTVHVLNDSTFAFVSGGMKSKYYKSTNRGKTWSSTSIPYFKSEASGAFSLAFYSDSIGIVVGGDYSNPDMNLNNSYYTDDAGEFWINSEEQVRGYRSCVIFDNETAYSCGTNGIDVSFDFGKKWIPFADGNFFTMAVCNDQLIATSKDGTFYMFDLAD